MNTFSAFCLQNGILFITFAPTYSTIMKAYKVIEVIKMLEADWKQAGWK